jgi:hypothetical protein
MRLVRWLRSFLCALPLLGVLAGCSDGTGPDGQVVLDCTEASVRTLAVGQHQIINPIEEGACIRLPGASSSGAEHLYVPLATAGNERPDGVSAAYRVQGTANAVASSGTLPSPRLSAFRSPLGPEAFHQMLRQRERALAQNPAATLFRNGAALNRTAIPPAFGEQRTFNVLRSSDVDGSSASDFVQTTATAQSIGRRVAIFVDNAAPAGGYTPADLDDVRTLFDDFLYSIDTTAFGVESDIDNNQVVIVLLTQRVNQLSADCNRTVILGYFFGADLLPPDVNDNPGSNNAEIFYGLVPDPSNAECEILPSFARTYLPSTFIHEFQHMISFNQHVLLRDGPSEETWLNEGLSHFAEELGGRLVPASECPTGSCFNEFLPGDVSNAFAYLSSPEEFFLIEPGNSSGELPERGANWLFVRWLADHFAADTIRGTELTRKLVATSAVGSANVEAQTGESFSTLVSEWQLANYLDDLPGFSEPTGRLRYKSWNFREEADSRGLLYPLVPETTNGSDYTHSGTLRAGSGQHILVVQDPGATSVDMALTSPAGGSLSGTIVPRIALVRVR